MRIPCPHCGTRDVQEFTYFGAADPQRPKGMDAPASAMVMYVYMRDNPAGLHRELWHHSAGCRAWLAVTRDTLTHEITGAETTRRARTETAA